MKIIHRPRKPVAPAPKKPILLMNVGIGWAATTPFLYTLTIDQRYCHPGHVKENHYLYTMHERDDLNETPIKDFITQSSVQESHWLFRGWQKELYEYSYHFMDDPDYIRNWYEDASVEKYIDYYLKHWKVIKNDFHAVADFSNHNWSLPLWENGANIIRKIQDVFDLKVTVQFRDPIRRLYSELGTCFIDERTPYIERTATDKKMKEGALLLRYNKHNEFFKYCLTDAAHLSDNCKYMELYDKWEWLVGPNNILPIIMEEFWNPQYRKQQCERLSKFLDAPIQKIHRNAYFPDVGADASHLHRYEGLIDQWTSDKETITEETIEYSMKYFKPCYDRWKQRFGELPEAWNKP
tara:strand:- start:77 stop:1129 length:1053 start_codon:yes stop_codon:yes gene_type:complete